MRDRAARIFVPTALSAAALVASCAGETDPGSGRELPCDVERVLAAECRDCHSSPPKYGAPMALVTHDDLTAPALSARHRKVYELVGERTHDDRKPMPEPPRPRLRAEQQKAIDDWIARGAPAGAGTCSAGDAGKREGGEAAPPIEDPPPGCPNVTLRAASAWSMPQSTKDEYVCFGVDVSLSKKRHVVGFWPKIQNQTIAHHALVYLADASFSSTPTPCSAGGVVGKRLVYGWAPGGEHFELPPEAGLPIEGTAHFVVQMHYSNLGGLAGQTDHSSIELCTTDELRANDADVMAFGTFDFDIPARSTARVDCRLDVPAPLPPTRIFRSMPHMHQLGKSIGSKMSRGGAAPVVIDDVETWRFGVQPWNATDVTIQAGDRIDTWCEWANGTDEAVGWGEETEREMCYHFVMYYPRISVPGWRWDAPLGLSSCSP